MAGRIRSIASAVHNRRALLPPLVVVGGLLLLLWPVLFGDQTLFYRDLYRQHMGTARLLHDGLPNGLLWDPLLNGGQPLLGNPNRFVLYPTRLLYIILQPLTGLNWEIALHLLLGGLGTVFLARRLGLAGTGSAVAGAAYALGGFSISLTNHLGRLFAYHWLPWIVLAVVAGSARSPTARWWRAAVPVLLAVQWLTGAAELSLMAAVLVVAWTVFFNRQGGNRLRALWRASLWIVLGVCLAAIQVLPAAEMVLRSERTEQAGTVLPLSWSLDPVRLPELLVPGFCGPVDVADPSTSYWGAELVDFGFPYLLSLYLGASVLLLAVIGWVASGKDRPWWALRWLLGGLAAGGVLLALGRNLPLLSGVFAYLPGLSLVRFPVKMVLLAGLPVALLAGRGADGIMTADSPERRHIRLVAAVVSGTGLLLAICVFTGLAAPVLASVFGKGAGQASAGLGVPVLHSLLATVAVTLAAFAAGRVGKPALLLLLTGIVVADLFGAAAASLPMAPTEVFARKPEILTLVQNHLGTGRFFRDDDPPTVHVPLAENRAWVPAAWWSRILVGPLAANWGVPMIFNPDSELLASRRMASLTRWMESLAWEGRLRLLGTGAATVVMTPQQTDVASLKTIATNSPVEGLTYAVDRILPPTAFVRWVGGARRVSSNQKVFETLASADFDPDHEVVLETGAPTTRTSGGPVELLQPKVEVWHGELTAPDEGWAVTAIAWHPDLLFKVDGRLVRAERLNYAFSGTPVDAGKHSLRVEFAPRSVLWGGLVTGVAALLLVGIIVRGRGKD